MTVNNAVKTTNICAVCGHEWAGRRNTLPHRCPDCNSTLWNCRSLVNHSCRRCGYKWFGRGERPVRCPRCRSKLWDAVMHAYRCGKCGFSTDYREGRTVPADCPVCGSLSWEPIGISSCVALMDGEIVDTVRETMEAGPGMEFRTECLEKKGMDRTDAEVWLRYLGGENKVEIARKMGITFEDVNRRIMQLCRRSRRG